eukprot:1160931-Pelagomonas_calceolata.AAC.3
MQTEQVFGSVHEHGGKEGSWKKGREGEEAVYFCVQHPSARFLGCRPTPCNPCTTPIVDVKGRSIEKEGGTEQGWHQIRTIAGRTRGAQKEKEKSTQAIGRVH